MRSRQLALVSVSLLILLAAGIAAMAQEVYKLGPSGGPSGRWFEDKGIPPASRTQVIAVHVSGGKQVDRVKIVHASLSPEFRAPAFRAHGGGGGTERVFELGPGEHLVAISGRYGDVVDSLVLHTSAGRQSVRYGGEGGGGRFRYEAPPGYEIAGFFGKAGSRLDAIGVVLRPLE